MAIIVKSGIIGGILLFLWSAISWMALPFHHAGMKAFSEDFAVETVLETQGKAPGVYLLPGAALRSDSTPDQKQVAHKQMQKGPFALIIYNPQGGGPMGMSMAIALGIQTLSAMLITALLLKTGGMNYWGRVFFVVSVALTAGVICFLPMWNWWGYSPRFLAAEFLDLFVGWFLAGLAIAKLTK